MSRVFGTVFRDDNEDGIRDPRETGIVGSPVSLVCNGIEVGSMRSTPDYHFVNVPVGDCEVRLGGPQEATKRITVKSDSENRADLAVVDAASPLALTGANSRRLVGAAIVMIWLGLLLVGKRRRRSLARID